MFLTRAVTVIYYFVLCEYNSANPVNSTTTLMGINLVESIDLYSLFFLPLFFLYYSFFSFFSKSDNDHTMLYSKTQGLVRFEIAIDKSFIPGNRNID